MSHPGFPRGDAERLEGGENALLRALLRHEPGLGEAVDYVDYPAGKELCDEGRPIRFVHFPLSGVISCLVTTREGTSSEVMSVGNEGLVGLPLYFGVRFSLFDLLQQMPGRSARLPVPILRERVGEHPGLAQFFQCYAAYELRFASQQAVCRVAHSVIARVCRGLLVAQDRAGGARFQLPQKVFARMLGANRVSVSEATSERARAGLLEYRRTWVTVHDRQGIEQRACECYRLMERYRHRLLANRLPTRRERDIARRDV